MVERIEAQFTVTVAGVVINDKEQVLLLKHVFRPGSGWGIPGGFIESREQPEDAIKRELKEEVGLGLSDIKLLTVVTHKHVNQVIIAYACRPASELTASSFEIQQAQWFDVADLPPSLPSDQVALIRYAMDAQQKIDRDELCPREI